MKRFKPLERVCDYCHSSYMANREWQKYCSPACRVAHWRNEHPVLTPSLIDDIKKIQINLGKNFNDLKRIMDSYLNELPEEAQKKINPIRTDINKIMKEENG